MVGTNSVTLTSDAASRFVTHVAVRIVSALATIQAAAAVQDAEVVERANWRETSGIAIGIVGRIAESATTVSEALTLPVRSAVGILSAASANLDVGIANGRGAASVALDVLGRIARFAAVVDALRTRAAAVGIVPTIDADTALVVAEGGLPTALIVVATSAVAVGTLIGRGGVACSTTGLALHIRIGIDASEVAADLIWFAARMITGVAWLAAPAHALTCGRLVLVLTFCIASLAFNTRSTVWDPVFIEVADWLLARAREAGPNIAARAYAVDAGAAPTVCGISTLTTQDGLCIADGCID